jgi:hypothetical protein
MLGVVHDTPELLDPKLVPPVEPENHSMVPALAVAEIPTVPVPQREPPDEAVIVGVVHAGIV